jgi:hypothetical protein
MRTIYQKKKKRNSTVLSPNAEKGLQNRIFNPGQREYCFLLTAHIQNHQETKETQVARQER